MNQTSTKKSIRKTIIIFSSSLLLSGVSLVHAQTAVKTNTTTEINGKKFLVHTIAAKDTYYQLSRTYGVAVKDILAANNSKNLTVGDVAHIPVKQEKVQAEKSKDKKEKPPIDKETSSLPNPNQQETINAKILTEYKVGPKETLYSIAQRFATTVDDIKLLNKLADDSLKEDQLLKIPDGKVIVTKPAPVTEPNYLPIPEVERQEIEFETNRLGIREKKEKGIGMWMDNLEANGQSNLALHRTAPVGTILKITNPLTKSVTFAKVVGKFTNTAESHDAIVILSKSAASYIGAFDKRFLIEIAYGAPLN